MYSYSLSPRVMVSVTKDVEIDPNTVADGDILQYNAAQQVWTNVTRGNLGIVLTDLADIGVDPMTLVDGQVLQYDAGTSTWISHTLVLDDLGDVSVPAPSAGDFLAFNGLSGEWSGAEIVNGTGIDVNYTDVPGAYVGAYDNGTSYAIGDIVSTDGNPYGTPAGLFIRTSNPGNPGYPPAVGGGNNAEWDAYPFTSNVTVSLDANLNNLNDVVLTSPAEFQTLEYDGTQWINKYASVVTEVRNVDTVTLTTGTAVYLFGASGDIATVKRADNDSDVTSSKVVGLVGASIAQNNSGPVITRGYVDGINLSVGYAPGDILYLGEDGGFTKVKPVAPEHTVFLGVVCRANANGIVYVATQNGYELDELHDVKIDTGTLADGDVLTYDTATSLWVNAPAAGGASALNDLTDVTITSPADYQIIRYHAGTTSWRNEDPSLQTPVTTKWHYPLENNATTYNQSFAGNASRVVFDTACSITDIAISQSATFSGATSNTWRLGIYRDSGSNYPGALEVDAGTVNIATGSTAGFKGITLGTAVSVAANEIIWLVISLCSNNSSPFPSVYIPFGHASPYRDQGTAGTFIPGAVGYSYGGASGTALPATFGSGAAATAGGAPMVFVKVTVP